MNTLILKNINKTYPNGVRALDNVFLELTNGMFGLLGPNGAGKSSLMRTIAGLQPIDSGSIYFNENDIIQDWTSFKKHLGFLPQDFGVYPKISAYNLLSHIAILKGITHKGDRTEQVNLLLQKVNLFDQRKQEVFSFSGGMKQRFGIAQALLGDPKIIIVDEPTAGLDPEERNRFNGLLSEIGENIIIILSTHLVDDVKMLCPRMAVMSKGQLLAIGNPEDFINKLNGKLWSKNIEKNNLLYYEDHFNVLSKHYSKGLLSITVYDEVKPEGFDKIDPKLEDAYFSILPK